MKAITFVTQKGGSGKSTLCKVIAGALAPSGGTLRIDGQERSFASPRV